MRSQWIVIINVIALAGLTRACKFGEHGWPLASYDNAASGFNAHEHQIDPATVNNLRVEWVFDKTTAGRPIRPMHATPVVDARGNSYIGDFGGTFFSISPTGQLRWSFAADAPTLELAALLSPDLGTPDGSPFIGGAALASNLPYVIVGDANGRIYARDVDSGAEVWTVRGLDANPLGGVAGNSIAIFGDMALVGMASLENYALVLSAAGLRVDCCSHRGALIALDLATGKEQWRFYTSPASAPLPSSLAPFVQGPAGADIWSQPTYDSTTSTIYVSTGQNLSPTATGTSTPTSDSIIAIDSSRGTQKWVHQFTENDVWAVGVPNPNPVTGQKLDMDLGDSPKIFVLPNGRKVVGAGQKDGRYHVLDAQTGEVISTAQVVTARNDLGGFQTGGAHAYGRVFLHGLDATDGFSDCNDGTCPYQGFNGIVVAVSDDGKQVMWRHTVPTSPILGGLAVANGLVYFQSPVEEATPLSDAPQWGLYAVSASTGEVKMRMTFPGRALGSPVVTDGHVYITKGNGALAAYGIFPEGGLMRLSVRSDGG